MARPCGELWRSFSRIETTRLTGDRSVELTVELSKRERQVVEILYRLGEGTARQVHAELPDPPGYTSVRTHLKLMVDKGILTHRKDGVRFVYRPALAKDTARRRSVRQLVDTFFDGSISKAVSALVNSDRSGFSDEELDELAQLIAQAKRQGR